MQGSDPEAEPGRLLTMTSSSGLRSLRRCSSISKSALDSLIVQAELRAYTTSSLLASLGAWWRRMVKNILRSMLSSSFIISPVGRAGR